MPFDQLNFPFPHTLADAEGPKALALIEFLQQLFPQFVPDVRPGSEIGSPQVTFYGPRTADVVKQFQLRHGLPQAGTVDWVTGHFLEWTNQRLLFTRVLRPTTFGNEFVGNDVKALRDELKEWRKARGIGDEGVVKPDQLGGSQSDNAYGPVAASAVNQFKQLEQLTDDSIVNRVTIDKILRSAHPLQGANYSVNGTLSSGPSIFVQLYAFTPADTFLLAETKTGASGAFNLPFALTNADSNKSLHMDLLLIVRVGDRLLSTTRTSARFEFNASGSPVITGSTSINVSSKILCGVVVKPSGDDLEPAPGKSVRALTTELVTTGPTIQFNKRRPLGAPAITDGEGFFELNFDAPSGDVSVEAFDAGTNEVFAATELFFNLAPIEFIAKLVLPPDGILPPIELQPPTGPSEFDLIVTEMTASNHAPHDMGEKLDLLGPVQRDEVLRYMAGDLAVKLHIMPRPQAEDAQYESNIVKYEQAVERYIRNKIVPLSKVIQAFRLAKLADQYSLQTSPGADPQLAGRGYQVRLPLQSGKQLMLNLDKTSVAAPLTLAPVFYALLPNAKTDIPAEQGVQLVTRMAPKEIRLKLEQASRDNIIRLPPPDIDEIIVWLAEFRLQNPTPQAWHADIDALIGTGVTRKALSEWLQSENDTRESYLRIDEAGRKNLEWIALTFAIPKLEIALKPLTSGANSSIDDLENVPDINMRQALNAAGITSAEVKAWPAPIGNEAGNTAAAIEDVLSHLRKHAPFMPVGANALETKCIRLCLGLIVEARRILALRYVVGSGSPQTIAFIEDVRHVPDIGAGALYDELLSAALTPDVSGQPAWTNWPKPISGQSADESAKLLFDRIRHVHPSAATGLVSFFASNPGLPLPLDLTSVTSRERIEKAVDEAVRGDAHNQGVVLEALKILSLLWDLTVADTRFPVNRSIAVSWLFDNGKTTRDLVGDIDEAEIALIPAGALRDSIQKAKDRANNLTSVIVPVSPSPKPINANEHLVDCEASPHRSLLGPAAYLVYLYKTTTDAGLSLPTRPDISQLLLDEYNTESLLPEIDIVNEVLESHCSGTAIVARQTTRTSDELTVLPEYAAPNSPFSCWANLRDSFSPSPLPYNHRLDAARSYLSAFETSRWHVMRVFRREISMHHPTHMLRAPMDQELAWEWLNLSREQATALNSPISTNLAAYFAFDFDTLDAQVINQLTSLPVFLRHCELDLAEFVELVRTQPAWLTLRTMPVDFGCDLPNTTIHEFDATGTAVPLTAITLGRLYQHLLIWRNFRDQFDRGSAPATAFGVVSAIATSLNYYHQVSGHWILNSSFLEELASLQQLWKQIRPSGAWTWFSDNTHTGGLSFATDSIVNQRQRLSEAIPLPTARPTNMTELEWTALETSHGTNLSRGNWETLERLSGLNLADATSGPSLGRDERIRRALRLVELAETVVSGEMPLVQLQMLFWGIHDLASNPNGANPRLVTYPDSETAFGTLNAYFRSLPKPSAANEEERTQDEVRDILESMGFLPDAGTNPGANSSHGICRRLERILANNVGEPYKAPYPNNIPPPPPPHCWRINAPFVIESGSIRITRSPTEREIVCAMQLISRISNIIPNWTANHEKLLCESVAALAQMPRNDLRFLIPILPNQREALQRLIDPENETKPLTSDERRWGYVYRQLNTLQDGLISHFLEELCPTFATTEHRKLIHFLLFGMIRVNNTWEFKKGGLRSFSQPDESPYRDSPSQALLELPPTAIWRDLILPKGTGIRGEYSEGSPSQLIFSRRDGDLNFVAEGKELALGRLHSWPFGLTEDSPDPTRIPESLNFSSATTEPWRAVWNGLIRIPHDPTTHDIFVAVNLGFCQPNDNCAELRIGLHSVPKWVPCDFDIHTGEVKTWQRDGSPKACKLSVYGPFESLAAFDCFTATFVDPSECRERAQFCMAYARIAKGQGGAPPDLRAFTPLTAGCYFVPESSSLLEPLGWKHFVDAYDRAWLASCYSLRMGFLAEEIAYFTQHGDAFAGFYPTFGTAPPTVSEVFDLNTLYPLPASDVRRQALFDQWERLREHAALRNQASANSGSDATIASGRLLAVYDKAYLTGTVLNPAPIVAGVLAPVIADAIGWTGADPAVTAIVGQCFDFVEKSSPTPTRLRHQDLWNHEWIRRMYLAADMLRSGHPWMGNSRMSGDTARNVVQQDLSSQLSPDLLNLFTATHYSNTTATHGVLTEIHNGLRERGRQSMLAYLTVKHSSGGRVGKNVSDLSDELLLDVDCAVDRKVSRVESAIATLQRFLARHNYVASNVVPFLRFKKWVVERLGLLFPENTVAIREQSEKTLTFRDFERRLNLNQLSLHRPPSGSSQLDDEIQQHFRLLDEIEQPVRTGNESLRRQVSGLEKHSGWLAPLGSTFPNGWQRGPNDLRAAVLYTHISSDQEFLFWPVASIEHIDNSQERQYAAPDENGEATTVASSRTMIRLGWSSRYKDESIWRESQLSTEWMAVADPNTVPLVIVPQGDVLQVSCGSGNGFIIPVEDRQFVAPASAAVLPRFFPSSSYGGLISLPKRIVVDPAVIAPDLPVTQFESSAPRPAFGLSDDEREFFAYYTIATNLISRRKFSGAKFWLERIVDAPSADLEWQKLDTRSRAAVLKYLEVLQQWSSELLRENTEESCRLASAYHRQLNQLLGRAPRRIKHSRRSGITLSAAASVPTNQFETETLVLNPRLRSIWGYEEQLALTIRQRLNGTGLRRPQLSREDEFFQPSHFIAGSLSARSPYRFTYLLQRALEAANEAKSLGQSLLSAIERGDSEHLAQLRANSEQQITELTRDQRRSQWEEAETQWRVLRQNRFNTGFRKRYYEELINGGINGGERAHLDLLQSSQDLTVGAQVVELAAQAISLIPDLTAGGAGISSPVAISKLTGGEKISRMMEFVARGLHSIAGKMQVDANRTLTNAGYDRRRREWEFQRDSAAHELTWIERQIDAAQQRMQIARNEINIQQQQFDFATRQFEFLRTKFSNTELNDWLRDKLLSLYEQSFKLAAELAEQCENAFFNERHFVSSSFIADVLRSDFSRTPLLSSAPALGGEALVSALKRMEKQYNDDNYRENELMQHFSLRLYQPTALIALRTTGICELEVPEWLFDLNYPGHYMRRIKSIGISLPCIIAPYQTVNCTLTQLASEIRHDPNLEGQYDKQLSSAGDSRFVRTIAAGQSIATTAGQNDSGMFELIFRDERLLPFEGTGAISRWRVELPSESNWFDLDTVTDVILHIRYTSLDAGHALRAAAFESACLRLPSETVQAERLIDVRHDLPAEWSKLLECATAFCVPTSKEYFFPWQSASTTLVVTEVELLIVRDGNPSWEYEEVFVQCPGDPTDHKTVLFRDRSFPNTYRGIFSNPSQSTGEWHFKDLTSNPSDVFVKIRYYYAK